MKHKVIYELAVLYYDKADDEFTTVSDKLKKELTGVGAKILKEDVWGSRTLAYPIKKQTKAIYVFYDLEIDGQVLTKLEASFNISDDILRYQFYKPDLKALDLALKHPETQIVIQENKDDKEESEAEVKETLPAEEVTSDVT